MNPGQSLLILDGESPVFGREPPELAGDPSLQVLRVGSRLSAPDTCLLVGGGATEPPVLVAFSEPRQETAVSLTKEMSGCRRRVLIHICESQPNKHSSARLWRPHACVLCTWQLKRALGSSAE